MAVQGEVDLQASDDSDPAIRIQEIRQLLKAPDSEDQRFRNAQLLSEADDWLAQHVRAEGYPERLVLLHIKIMRALRAWGRVIEGVRGQVWKNRRVKARALCEAGIAYMHLQEFTSAERCFGEAVKLDPEVELRVTKARARLEGQLRLDLYGRLAAFIYKAVCEGNVAAAEHLYRSASHVYGLPDSISGESIRVIRTLAAPPDAEATARPARPGSETQGRLVITCGAGYSGTGAVTAYFRELDGISMPFGIREVAVAKKNYGIYRLLSHWQGWTPEERQRGLREFTLKAILGVPCYASQASVDRLQSRSITVNSLFLDEGLEPAHVAALADDSVTFVEEASAAKDEAALRKACAVFLNRVLRVKGGDTLLLNNCIHQTQIGMCDLLENARVIVIVRDPRDQFVAHQTETRGKGTTIEAFIRKRKRADSAVERYLRAGPEDVRVFRFEDFVTTADVREEVKAWAGLAGFSAASTGRFFVPEKSARNVGIHKTWKHVADIRRIEEELGDQLFEP